MKIRLRGAMTERPVCDRTPPRAERVRDGGQPNRTTRRKERERHSPFAFPSLSVSLNLTKARPLGSNLHGLHSASIILESVKVPVPVRSSVPFEVRRGVRHRRKNFETRALPQTVAPLTRRRNLRQNELGERIGRSCVHAETKNPFSFVDRGVRAHEITRTGQLRRFIARKRHESLIIFHSLRYSEFQET